MSDEDFEVSFPDLPPVRLFCEDPLENLRLHVLVKRVPQQVHACLHIGESLMFHSHSLILTIYSLVFACFDLPNDDCI